MPSSPPSPTWYCTHSFLPGGGKGIGEATARLMAAAGASVVVADMDSAAAAQVVDAIKKAGGRAVAVTADITSADAPAHIVKEVRWCHHALSTALN